MRILIASGIYPPDIGGPATYAKVIANALIEKGHKVKVISYGEKSLQENSKFQIVRISRKWPKGIRYIIYFLKLFFLSRNTDLIFALNPVSVGFLVRIAAWILRKKYVVRIVGDNAWEKARVIRKTNLSINDFQKAKKPGLTIKILSRLQAKTCQKAKMVIVPSNFLAEIVSGWNVDRHKIKVVYNGVDFKPPDISKEEAREKIKISGDIVLSVGRLVPWKGFEALINIVPELLRINPSFRLIIVGDGPEEKRLKRLVKKLGLESKVYLVGRKTKDELRNYYAAADLFTLNTGYEGFSHIILEAMAIGSPIITTNVCGNPEIVKDSYNGLLVEYNNKKQLKEAILKLWKDKELREKLTVNAKKSIEKFTKEKMVRETLKILE